MVSYTPNKGLALPAVAGDSGVWGGELNNGTTTPVDLMLGGANTVTLASANYTLSSTDILYLTQKLSGTLLANVIVYSASSGFYFVENNTTGSFTVTWQANFGTGNVGTAWLVPRGARMLFISDSTSGARPAPGWPTLSCADLQEIGTPGAPPSGYVRLYAKSGDIMATLTPGGTECLFGVKPTVRIITSGTGTYTPPAGVVNIRVRMRGPSGGSGGAQGNGGAASGPTVFGDWTAAAGAPGVFAVGHTSGIALGATGGVGGTDGTGTLIRRQTGGNGGDGVSNGANFGITGCGGGNGAGPSKGFVGSTSSATGISPVANSGAGASGGGSGVYAFDGVGSGSGAGEEVEFWKSAGAVAYTIPTGGAAGYAGGAAGSAGGIWIEEFYC